MKVAHTESELRALRSQLFELYQAHRDADAGEFRPDARWHREAMAVLGRAMDAL